MVEEYFLNMKIKKHNGPCTQIFFKSKIKKHNGGAKKWIMQSLF